MNSRQTTQSESNIAKQLGSIPMSDKLHAAALRSAFIAELLVDAIVRACEKFARKRAETVMKSGVYHWE